MLCHEILWFTHSKRITENVDNQSLRDTWPGVVDMGDIVKGKAEGGGDEYTHLYGEQPDKTWVE